MTENQTRIPEPAAELLALRELKALKLITTVRFIMMAIMAPLMWILGASRFDQMAMLSVIVTYLAVAIVSASLVRHKRHLKLVGLMGVGMDVFVISILPVIWYSTLGGTPIPVGFTLKTSVTLISILLIALNTLAMRPLYPLLVTIGSLLVHLSLIVISMIDSNTVFTSSYLLSYTTSDISIGRVVTRIAIVAMVGGILTLLTMRARKMVIESAKMQKTNDQLGRYFSPNLVPRLAENPALFELGGERKELSFVFTDLEGFTTLIEENQPSFVIPVLNEYLDQLIQVVFKYEGTLDKIVGDAIHIIFGAPEHQPDHAQRAVLCALELDRVAEKFRQQKSSTLAIGITRIGVNSGPAIVGNFGGEAFFDYTAYGDAINVAARLESANKFFGSRICVSGDTTAQVVQFEGRPVGEIQLKGKTNSISVFEPVNSSGAQDANRSDLQRYLDAYESMRTEQPDALNQFKLLNQQFPEDTLVKFHLRRLQSSESGIRIRLEDK
jgi:class 3 adenylate cyclase